MQRPLATVVIGGILSSTFLTLVLLPTLYEWLERRGKPRRDDESEADLEEPATISTEEKRMEEKPAGVVSSEAATPSSPTP